MNENAVKQQVIEYLWRIGWLVLRVNSGAITQTDSQTKKRRHFKFCTWYALGFEPQSAGVSDVLAVEPGTGRLWVIEIKAPGKLGNMTQGQRDFQGAARERGAVAICVDSLDMLLELIREAAQ